MPGFETPKPAYRFLVRHMHRARAYYRRRLHRHVRRRTGTGIGALAGVVGGLGLFGAILGGLIGFLVDELAAKRSKWRRIDLFFATGRRENLDDRSTKLAAISALAGSTIALSDSRHLGSVGIGLAKRRIAETFDLEAPEREAIDYFVDRFMESEKPAIDEICAALRDLSDNPGREAIILLLYRVAPGEGESIDASQDEFVRRVSESLEIDSARFAMLRSTIVPTDDEAYRILGIETDASTDEIRRIYRRLASQFHPDSNIELGNERMRISEEAFIRIQNAYNRIISERSAQRKTADP